MRVTVYPPDPGACGHYRLIFPAQALQAQGYDVVIDDRGPICQWMGDPSRHGEGLLPPADTTLVGLEVVPETDVVVFSRQANRRWWSDLIPHWQKAGIRVVVDLDDRYDKIHPANIAYEGFQNRRSDFGWKHIERACRLADRVTATTPALAHAYSGTATVLPNLVPERYFTIQMGRRFGQTVGWAGIVQTHPDDLQVTGGRVARAVDEADWRFHCIGDGKGVAEGLGLREVDCSGLVPFEFYMTAYSRLDIAIVPLADNLFNESKSCLKVLEAACLGIPAVASPSPDNLRAQRLSLCQIATTPGQWHRRISTLIANPELRATRGEDARESMKALTYENHAIRWWNAWTSG